jgi:hypothetical protein
MGVLDQIVDNASEFAGGDSPGDDSQPSPSDRDSYTPGLVLPSDQENSEFPYVAGEDPAYDPLVDANNDGIVTEEEYEQNTTPVSDTWAGQLTGGTADFLGGLTDFAAEFADFLGEALNYWKYILYGALVLGVLYIIRPFIGVAENATEGGA